MFDFFHGPSSKTEAASNIPPFGFVGSAKREGRCANARTQRYHLAAILPFAAVLAPLSILALVGWINWRMVWDDARTDELRAAGSVAEYGRRTLESYSFAAGRVNDRLRGLSDDDIRANEQVLQAELQRITAEVTQSELTYVIDRDGRTLLASNLFPAPKHDSVKDSDYFKIMSGPNPPPYYVSRTFPFDGGPLFSVSRLRRDTGNPRRPDGFDGIVLVSVNPHVLADGMRRLLRVPTDRIALMREDGYGISTTGGLVDLTKPLPRVDPRSPFYTFANSGATSAAYISTTAMKGSSSLLAMQRVEGFPIYAVSLRSTSKIVERWRGIMLSHLVLGLPATLGLLFLSLRVWRDQRLLAANNADLARDNALIADRLFRTKQFGLVGTFEFYPRTGVSLRSAEYMSIHGLPAAPAEETHDDWRNRLHPDDRDRADHEVRHALSDASGATHYAQTYRIITPGGEVRWIAARAEIARDEAGSAIMMLGAHVDVTPLRAAELALAESDARLRLAQEAVGIGAWEWRIGSRSIECSRKVMELLGVDFAKGLSLEALLDRVHPDDRRALRALLREAGRAGGVGVEFRIPRAAPAGEPDMVWLAARAKLVDAPDGSPPRLMGIAYDVTDRKRADDLAALMAREVEHRAKNALAIVSSLLRMSKANSAEELARVMEGRVHAISQTISLLGKGSWKGADLRDIIDAELAPYRSDASGDDGNILLSGPAVVIDPDTAQPLSMALHELATNAAKYGALSAPGGRVEVCWVSQSGRINLQWRERGGPRLKGPPPRSGFGSRLIASLFEGQIGGTMIKRWDSEGLVCEMSFRDRLTESDNGPTPLLTEGRNASAEKSGYVLEAAVSRKSARQLR